MRLLIAAVGKLKQGPERELCVHYVARAEALGRSQGLSPLSMVEMPEAKAADAKTRRAAEADALLAKVPPHHTLICLDPAGKMLSSEDLAGLVGKARDGGAGGIAFIIGGPDGLGDAVLEKAGLSISLGPMTLPHGLARIVLAEQLYRAMTILAGHPYHRS